MRWSFGDYQLDTDRYELSSDGSRIAVEPQAFEVLAYLVTNRERVVSRAELFSEVWGSTFVSDAALATRIKEARRAVGDDGRRQYAIRTVHGRGYRFVAETVAEDEPGAAPTRPSAATVAPSEDVRSVEEIAPARPRQILDQEIRFCRTADDVNLAYTSTGDGPPLVKVANWLTHLEFDVTSPVWRHLVEDLSEDFELIRYDERGTGLSDWDVEEWSFEAWVRDLETVVDARGLERFALLGISQGGPVALAYAARHPERVSHLVLQGAYGRGRTLRGGEQAASAVALRTLTEQGWGRPRSPFADLFSSMLLPGGTDVQRRWLTDLQDVSTSAENALKFRGIFDEIDIEGLLPSIRSPALVMHSKADQTVPFPEGRRLAASLPDARLLPLDSENHLLLEHEPAWTTFRDALRDFLADDTRRS